MPGIIQYLAVQMSFLNHTANIVTLKSKNTFPRLVWQHPNCITYRSCPVLLAVCPAAKSSDFHVPPTLTHNLKGTCLDSHLLSIATRKPYGSIYIKFLKWQNYSDGDQVSCFQGLQRGLNQEAGGCNYLKDNTNNLVADAWSLNLINMEVLCAILSGRSGRFYYWAPLISFVL